MFTTSAAWARVPRVNPIGLELVSAPLAGPLTAAATGLTAPAADFRAALFTRTPAGEFCLAGPTVALNATGAAAAAGAATAVFAAPPAGATTLVAALYAASYAVPAATCYSAGPADALLPPPFPWIALSAEIARTATASASGTPSVTPSGSGTAARLAATALPTPSPANIAGAGANATATPVVTGSLTPDGASAAALSALAAALLAGALAAVAGA